MDFSNLYRGLLIGFSIAAPLGPIGVLCVRRTLVSGWWSGFTSGLGAATADAFYGSIAAFGLTFISDFLIREQVWLRLIGGAFLCYLGIKTIATRPANSVDQPRPPNMLTAYSSTFFLTLTNPLTILFFAAVFTGLGLVMEQSSYASAARVVLGVFLGSSLWWITLSTGVHLLRSRFRPTALLWVNRISGLIILGFGIFSIVEVIPRLSILE